MVQVVTKIEDIPGSDLSTSQAHRGTPDTMIQQYAVTYVDNAAAITVETAPIHIALKGGTINAVEAMLITPCDDDPAAETVTVDIQKGSEGAAYATILDAPISFSVADAARAVKAAVLATTTYAEGDSFVVVTTNANADEAQGLVVVTSLREQPS
jgi:hypothetical protein